MLLNRITKKTLGLVYLVLAQFCISINIVVNKYLMQKSPAISLLSLRFVISGIILCGLLRARDNSFNLIDTFNSLSTKCKLSIVIQGLLGGFLFNILMLTGLQYTTATMTGIISSLVPTLIILLSFVLFKEKSTKHELISVAIATTGIIFINLTKITSSGLDLSIFGNLLILAALFPEALYTIVAKTHPVKACPLTHSTLINIVNAIAFCACFIMYPGSLASIANMNIFDWVLIVTVLSISGLMFFLLWTKGLESSTTQQAAIVTAVVPVGACILAFIFLNEKINLYDFIGIIMVVFAICVGTCQPGKAINSSAPLKES